jgi:hypothetical protein
MDEERREAGRWMSERHIGGKETGGSGRNI